MASRGAAAEPMIRLERVSKAFAASRPAVSGLSLDVQAAEVVCLVGPSGCGKTTTLRMINRLVEPTSGRVLVGGRDVRTVEPHELRRGIGYVIQQVGLFVHRTVWDNVATVPRLLGWERPRIESRVEELMTLVGLEHDLGPRYPAELSGGQQQRVGVARALAADPPVLLMDEPFGAVDPIVRTRLQDELLGLQDRLRKTIVFVTHDIDEAIKLGDRVVVMNVGGIVEQIATPVELLAHPASTFVADFVGSQRQLRRLGLMTVRELTLSDAGSAQDGPVIRGDATLLDALQAILSAGAVAARVVGDAGQPLGTLTLDRIAGELR
ncbi:MAG: ABC transporter ATP-binding protein [Actinomycetota bacterium]